MINVTTANVFKSFMTEVLSYKNQPIDLQSKCKHILMTSSESEFPLNQQKIVSVPLAMEIPVGNMETDTYF